MLKLYQSIGLCPLSNPKVNFSRFELGRTVLLVTAAHIVPVGQGDNDQISPVYLGHRSLTRMLLSLGFTIIWPKTDERPDFRPRQHLYCILYYKA